MPELRDTRVFEVDRAEIQARKLARLEAASLNSVLRHDVRYVAVDFARDSLGERLISAGWDPMHRSLFVWEGVTNYLSEPVVAGVLHRVGAASSGTTIVFTYIHRGVIDGTTSFEGADRLHRNVRRLGEPWTFGLDPNEMSPFLARFGLSLEQDVGADDYRRRYLGPTASDFKGYAFYRLAVASVPRNSAC